ncbi:hypothetical protein GUJ93_ZPchr0007g4200 [Zizania palustris]|uniref:Uncharacterized protein n=1 Tax=Zizania palustris TaxID=103762 RepID=A0A8J5T5N7_ZIZPA|nr:hypothetical protein GUJ93_ZPchr0007g4200 [Zizania palustris]
MFGKLASDGQFAIPAHGCPFPSILPVKATSCRSRPVRPHVAGTPPLPASAGHHQGPLGLFKHSAFQRSPPSSLYLHSTFPPPSKLPSCLSNSQSPPHLLESTRSPMAIDVDPSWFTASFPSATIRSPPSCVAGSPTPPPPNFR